MAETRALRGNTEGPGIPGGGPRAASSGGGRREPGRHSGGYRDDACRRDAPACENGYSAAELYPGGGYESAGGGYARDAWQTPPPDDLSYDRQRFENTGPRRRDRPYRSRYDRTDTDTDPDSQY